MHSGGIWNDLELQNIFFKVSKAGILAVFQTIWICRETCERNVSKQHSDDFWKDLKLQRKQWKQGSLIVHSHAFWDLGLTTFVYIRILYIELRYFSIVSTLILFIINPFRVNYWKWLRDSTLCEDALVKRYP